jgi:hypothetical protein
MNDSSSDGLTKRTGRPPRPGGWTEIRGAVNQELATWWYAYLADPVRGTVPKGSWSGLLEKLLRAEAIRHGYTGR